MDFATDFVEKRAAWLAAHSRRPRVSKLAAAVEWLEAELADGPALVTDLRARAVAAGHSERTLERARKEAGLIAGRIGFGRDSACTLRLPTSGDADAALSTALPDGSVIETRRRSRDGEVAQARRHRGRYRTRRGAARSLPEPVPVDDAPGTSRPWTRPRQWVTTCDERARYPTPCIGCGDLVASKTASDLCRRCSPGWDMAGELDQAATQREPRRRIPRFIADRVLALRADGLTYQEIADHFNSRGMHNVHGAPWRWDTVRRALAAGYPSEVG